MSAAARRKKNLMDLVALWDIKDVVSPIFDPDMGKRLQLLRMNFFWDQTQLAERLGASKSVISDIESGILVSPRKPITLGKYQEVFGDEHVAFLLLGLGEDGYDRKKITQEFWFTKNYVERDRTTPTSGKDHWFSKRHERLQMRRARKGIKSDG